MRCLLPIRPNRLLLSNRDVSIPDAFVALSALEPRSGSPPPPIIPIRCTVSERARSPWKCRRCMMSTYTHNGQVTAGPRTLIGANSWRSGVCHRHFVCTCLCQRRHVDDDGRADELALCSCAADVGHNANCLWFWHGAVCLMPTWSRLSAVCRSVS